MYQETVEQDIISEELLAEIDCFICPIMYDIMENPFISPRTGRSFEQKAIVEWVAAEGTDPLSRDPLNVEELIPNRSLQAAIAAWKKLNSDWQTKVNQFKAKNQSIVHQYYYTLTRFQISKNMTNKTENIQKKLKAIFGDIPEKYKKNPIEFQLLCNTQAYFINCELGKAIENLKVFLSYYPNDTWVRARLISSYSQLGNQTNIEEYFDTAISLCQDILNSESSEGKIAFLLQLGYLFRKKYCKSGFQNQNYLEQAVEVFQEVISLEPDNIKAHQLLAKVYMDSKRYEEAIEHHQIAIRLNPEGPEVFTSFNELGNIFKQLGDLERAEENFLKALACDALYYPEAIHGKLGNLYKLQARNLERDRPAEREKIRRLYHKAIKEFKRSIAILPNEIIYTNLGFCLTRLGPNEFEEAKSYYLEALKLNPSFKQAQKNLAWVERQQERSGYPMRNKSSREDRNRFFRERGQRRGHRPNRRVLDRRQVRRGI